MFAQSERSDKSISPTSTRSALVDVANTVLAHAALWVPLIVLMYFIPGLIKIFEKFDVELQRDAIIVIEMRNHFHFLVVILFVLLLVDGLILFLLNRGPITGTLSLFWSGLMTVIPLILLISATMALWLPLLVVVKSFHN